MSKKLELKAPVLKTNPAPEVKLILDRNIDNLTELTHYDTGSYISTISLDEFIFLGSKTSQYKQVGNAVPPLLAKVLAEEIKKYI